MRIINAGPSPALDWPGGDGTITLHERDAQSSGGAGAFNGGSGVFEVSYDGGNNWIPMTDLDGIQIEFNVDLQVRNFSSSACKVRCQFTGTASGAGVEFGLNPR